MQDLKPKNIFLTAKNHIRLGDLGCAKLMKTGLARTQIGTLCRRARVHPTRYGNLPGSCGRILARARHACCTLCPLATLQVRRTI
ncbi:hypothetical protein EON62_01900 [archaeon]|nr:MAG: hypothetical protein EON62_01900 [archaeon]